MAEASDNPRGSSETTPEEEDARRKNGSSSSKQVPRNRRSLELKKNGRDIYVNNQTPFKRLLYKCEKLFDKGASEIIIHGLGAVVFKTVNLALQLKENHHGILDLDIKTSTVTLVDKSETLNDDAENGVNVRQNSGIHIRVFRKVPFAALRSKQRQTDTDSAK